jgi:hypothetical protein
VSGLEAVGACVFPSGFRATILTRPVVVIDIAVLVVASVRATETLVVRWKRLKRPVISRVLDGGHVLAAGVPVDVIRTRAGH